MSQKTATYSKNWRVRSIKVLIPETLPKLTQFQKVPSVQKMMIAILTEVIKLVVMVDFELEHR